ncbi:MAG: NAD(P)/FAD-dependent oxidoreductase [Nevskiaceae bacterium]|nr:MAG: NAD(P)/FAD-dependent oxidoreductase [Nevskiaceae bacterium]TAM28227.1 MAG: NAD(P)/FAD-dependent oxidoreductase [Nevskiaceae bacterium]
MAFDAQLPDDGAPLSTLIIGTGFAGLGMAIRLKQEGQSDFLVLERAQGVGGTWRDNTYPGCACDVQSHLYSFSFEPNPAWSRMFAPQPEIKSYLEHCADKYGLAPHLRFGADVVEARYDEAAQLWQVKTRDGRRFQARALVAGLGGLSTPAYPELKGIATFKGKAFHSAEWDHGYDFRGKRVAVIGTGASAIQFVPQLQKLAGQVDLYQRTPPWIMPKPDRRISALEQRLFKRLPQAQRAIREAIYWSLEGRVLGFVLNPKAMKLPELLARRHIRKQIKDPALRAKVTPDFAFGCKRVLISDDYYPALSQANVEVISTGIREVKAHSIVTSDGAERPVDCIVYGTGFKAQDPLPRGAIFGRQGLDLLDAWKDGPEAYLGTSIHGFPNLFMLVGPNTGLGHSSMVYMIESQIAYVLDALKTMRRENLREIEVKDHVQARYNQGLQKQLGKAIWASGCKSWYVNASGKNTTLWPGFTFRFRQATRHFKLGDYRVSRVTETA